MPLFALGHGRRLRPLEEADADELHALIERNRPQLAMWLRWAQDQTPEQTLAFIHRARASESDNGGLQRAIVEQQRIVGMLGLPEIDWPNRSAEIGYWLDRAHQGQGLMTRAVAALVEHAFETLQLNRLEIRTDVENAPSRAVAERLGFRYEGTLRQSYRVVGERYSDDAVYSLLASDPGATPRPATLG
ncbi:MAG TPA: GNAT family protein [Solirubrobacteraceae bacterium]|nr:GNAT family protein [Solirubrobacteraceae bacterium]